MNIVIVDSNHNVVQMFDDIKLNDFGFYQFSFEVLSSFMLGHWKVVVNVNGRKKIKKFEVQQTGGMSIQAKVIMAKEVGFEDKYIYMDIKAKSPVNKITTVSATVTVNGHFVGEDKLVVNRIVKNITFENEIQNIEFNIQDDLGINFLSSDIELNFLTNVYEHSSKTETLVNTSVIVRHEAQRKIILTKEKFFRPGFKFPINVRVETFYGTLDNSFHMLNADITYFNRENQTSSIKSSLTNGSVILNLDPPAKSSKIEIIFTFGKTRLFDVIYPVPTHGAVEYIHADFDEKR